MRGIRWRVLSLVAGATMTIGVGSLYAISSWNAQLKETLHFSQAEISIVSSMALLGGYLSFFPGIIFDQIGPFSSTVIAGLGFGLIYTLLYVVLTSFPNDISAWSIGMCLFLVTQFGAFVIFSSTVVNEGIFGDEHRGKVMSLLTSSYSCGGALFAFVFHHWFDHNVPGYFLMLGIFLVVACVFGWFTFVPSPNAMRRKSDEIVDGSVSVALEQKGQDAFTTIDITGLELISDVRFWLLFFPVLIVIGAGLFVMSNVSFIVESRGGPMEQVPLMVVLFSASNTFTRLATGAISDMVLNNYPRATFAVLAVLMTACTQLVFLWVPGTYLAIAVTLAGIAEGVMFGIFPIILREEFGITHYGKNYGLLSCANAIGYPLFFSPISSYFYQRAPHHVIIDGIQKCFGPECFEPIHWLVISLCTIAFICCMKLFDAKSRGLYHAI